MLFSSETAIVDSEPFGHGFFFFSSRRRHTRLVSDWSSDVCSSDLTRVSVTRLPARRYLLNPGSIGQPRDGDPRAAFAIADLEHNAVQFWRAPYDIPAVQKRMRSAHLQIGRASCRERDYKHWGVTP